MAFTVKGAIFSTATVLRKSAVPLALVTLPVVALRVAMMFGLMNDVDMDQRRFGFLTIVVMWTGLALSLAQMVAATEIIMRMAADKAIVASRITVNALACIVPVFIAQFVFQAATIVGLALLIVPGLFFGAAFSLIIPAYVCERKGMVEAFSRSFDLTKGYRWKIGLTWLAMAVAAYLIARDDLLPNMQWLQSFGHEWLPAYVPSPPASIFHNLIGLLLFPVVQGLVVTLTTVFNATIYLMLRFGKDQAVDEHLLAIFE